MNLGENRISNIFISDQKFAIEAWNYVREFQNDFGDTSRKHEPAA